MYFEKFGEFDSPEELNETAAGLKAEGDTASLKQLGKENGIDKDDVQDYMDGTVDELVTPLSMAVGRLMLEKADINKEKNVAERTVLNIILESTEALAMLDISVERGICKKGMRIKNIATAMKEYARKHATGNIGVACGTDRQLTQIITAYYLGQDLQATLNKIMG